MPETIDIYIGLYIYMNMYMHVHRHMHVYAPTHPPPTNKHTHTHTRARAGARARIRAHMHDICQLSLPTFSIIGIGFSFCPRPFLLLFFAMLTVLKFICYPAPEGTRARPDTRAATEPYRMTGINILIHTSVRC